MTEVIQRSREGPDEITALVGEGRSVAESYEAPSDCKAALARFTRAPDLAHLEPLKRGQGYRWPDLPTAAVGAPRRARVTIATPDLVGPIRNGGIGTAYTALARVLAAAGHDVTLLYTLGRYCEQGTIEGWTASYRSEGIRFVPCPPVAGLGEVIGSRASLGAFEWLRTHETDVVHFPEWGGTAAYSVQAKRVGIAFQSTQLCVGVHSPTIWHDTGDGRGVDRIEQLERDALERRSVELADVVVSPSQYLLHWLDEAGWRLPPRTYVQPYIWPESVPARPDWDVRPVREIVFFGRLEFRKGLGLFCDAIDLLAPRLRDLNVRVTFLGKPGLAGHEDGEALARKRAAGWPLEWQILPDLDRVAALGYLRSRPALAVMPSVADNTPNTVIECLAAQIPFVSTTAGGIPELVHVVDHDRALAVPQADELARLVSSTFGTGVRPVRPSSDPESIRTGWLNWHARQVGSDPAVTPIPGTSHRRASVDLVSVCIATHERPELLEQALTSVREQTYRSIEVIVVDDGSESLEADAYFERLGPEFKRRGWTMLRQPRAFPGAARNLAARHARGRYILFMDDDNVARPDELTRLVGAAERSGAAIVTCGHDAFAGLKAPGSQTVTTRRWMPLGAVLPLALFTNCIGDTNMLIRREAFFHAGGFEEEQGAGLLEDWVFLLKAMVRGLQVEVFPEPLYWYRAGEHGFGQRNTDRVSHERAIRALDGVLPAGLSLALRFVQGISRSQHAPPAHGNEGATFCGQPDRRLRARLHRHLVSVLRGKHERLQPGNLERQFASGRRSATFVGTDGGRVTARHQATIDLRPGSIQIDSVGTDPQVHLLSRRWLVTGPLVLQIDVTSEVRTVLQLFWRTPRLPLYCEEQSSRLIITPGRQTAYAYIPDSPLIGPLRLDPSQCVGAFVFHHLEFRQVNLD